MSESEIVAHNVKVLRELKVGDTIEFPRGIYSHWAVYIGDEHVVHLAGEDNDGINANFDSGHLFTICGKRFKKAVVKLDDFWNVVLGCKAKVNKSKDRNMRMWPVNGHKTTRGKRFEKAFVKLEDFWNVVLGCKAKINNSKDRHMRPLRREEIVDRALSKLGEIGYNVMWSNCEHFASWCRYGKEKSE